jgi:hypothetical protein
MFEGQCLPGFRSMLQKLPHSEIPELYFPEADLWPAFWCEADL